MGRPLYDLAPKPHRARDGRMLPVALSVAAHAAILFALVSLGSPAPAPTTPPIIEVSLSREPPLAPPPPAPVLRPPSIAPASPASASPGIVEAPIPEPRHARTTPAPVEIAALPAAGGPVDVRGSGLSDAELAGAATAGSGPPGGACDMIGRLQGALRRDPVVQSAAAALGGRAVRVWDGDWVQSGGEDGKGLAAAREAIMWEVAFAPAACRAEPVRGLVLISLGEGAGSARLALGSAEWRWSDLLGAR